MFCYTAILEFINFDTFIQNNSDEDRLNIFTQLELALSNTFNEYLNEKAEHSQKHLTLEMLGNYFTVSAPDSTPRSFGDVIEATRLLIVVALGEGFPVRGCIHYGENLTDRPVHGKASMVVAIKSSPVYKEALDAIVINPMLGCLITAKALEEFDESRTKNTARIDDFIRLKVLVEVPFEGAEQKAIALNWLYDTSFNPSTEMLYFMFGKHNKAVDKDVETIIDNTSVFTNLIQAERLN